MWDSVLCGGNQGNSCGFWSVPEMLSILPPGAITIKDFKGNAGLLKEGFSSQTETEYQQMRTPHSR